MEKFLIIGVTFIYVFYKSLISINSPFPLLYTRGDQIKLRNQVTTQNTQNYISTELATKQGPRPPNTVNRKTDSNMVQSITLGRDICSLKML